MTRILQGGALRLIPTSFPSKVATLGQLGAIPRRPAWRVTVMCPDGSDPGVPANIDTVYAGPAGQAALPIGPGKSRTFTAVLPGDVQLVCATANQVAFVDWGGEPPE